MEDKGEKPKDYIKKPEGHKQAPDDFQSEQDVGPSAFQDAIDRAQESNDDREVEAAGREGGLRGALAARFDKMNEASRKYAEKWRPILFSDDTRGLVGLSTAAIRYFSARGVEDVSRLAGRALRSNSKDYSNFCLTMDMGWRMDQVTQFLRERLMPKTASGKSTSSTSAKSELKK